MGKKAKHKSLRIKNLGFTLIELLVIIAIVGVLASGLVVLINPSAQLAKARDARRKQMLHQLQIALEQYANDHDGKYPLHFSEPNEQPYACTNPGAGNCSVCDGQCQAEHDPNKTSWNKLQQELGPYLQKLPEITDDPTNSWIEWQYTTSVRGAGGVWTLPGEDTRYCLGTHLENANDPDINNKNLDPGNPNPDPNAPCNKFQYGCATNYYICFPNQPDS